MLFIKIRSCFVSFRFELSIVSWSSKQRETLQEKGGDAHIAMDVRPPSPSLLAVVPLSVFIHFALILSPNLSPSPGQHYGSLLAFLRYGFQVFNYLGYDV